MNRILVTGAAGFIGFHTCIRLINLGYRVVGLDNINDYYDRQLKLKRLEIKGVPSSKARTGQIIQSSVYQNYHFIQQDLKNKNKLISLFRKQHFDFIIHLAAQPGARYSFDHPETYIESNIYSFLNILESCRKYPVKHLLYASSSSVYGNNSEIPYTESHRVDFPVSLYGATKKTNELMAFAYNHTFGIPLTGLRFFTVYGPWGRPDMVYFKFTKAILENKPLKVFNNGKLKRDFTYIDDIVDGILGLLKAGPEKNNLAEIYNIGNSKPVEMLDFIDILEKTLKKNAIREMVPMQAGDVIVTYADTSKLEKRCGFKPFTSLETGLKKFTDWYLNEYKIKL